MLSCEVERHRLQEYRDQYQHQQEQKPIVYDNITISTAVKNCKLICDHINAKTFGATTPPTSLAPTAAAEHIPTASTTPPSRPSFAPPCSRLTALAAAASAPHQRVLGNVPDQHGTAP